MKKTRTVLSLTIASLLGFGASLACAQDLIIINGRNYDPQRLEWICDEIPEIRKGSTVAFSRPGPTSEELVIAVESRAADKDALIETIKQRINEEMQLTPADVAIAAVGSLPRSDRRSSR